MAADTGVALVTGAARRIGRAIALDLARHGWAVAVHYRESEAEARATAQEIQSGGARAALVRADLASEDEARALVGRAAAALGPLTCVVHNASVFEPDTLDTVTRGSWDRHLDANLYAPLVITREFARQLPEGADGNVIHLLDERVWSAAPDFLSYTVSKAGLWMLTRTLALALAPRVRVNGIGPGTALRATRQSREHFARQLAATPLGRGGSPEEIAGAVRFILDTPSLTGQMIALDGGKHLAGPGSDG